MKKLFNQICEEFGVVGASAVVFKNNELTSLNYGKATDEKETSENTIYRIASISKIIVALAAMKLVEEQKLDLDEDISVYLGFKLRNIYHPDKKITTRMLMTQTSSITDGLELAEGDVVDTGYNLVNEDENYYSVNAQIPVLNVNTDQAKSINSRIREKFYDMANSIMRITDEKTIYTVSYASFVNKFRP